MDDEPRLILNDDHYIPERLGTVTRKDDAQAFKDSPRLVALEKAKNEVIEAAKALRISGGFEEASRFISAVDALNALE